MVYFLILKKRRFKTRVLDLIIDGGTARAVVF